MVVAPGSSLTKTSWAPELCARAIRVFSARSLSFWSSSFARPSQLSKTIVLYFLGSVSCITRSSTDDASSSLMSRNSWLCSVSFMAGMCVSRSSFGTREDT